MTQFKQAKVIMLPTDDNTADLVLYTKRNTLYSIKNDGITYAYNKSLNPLQWSKQYLYIVLDDEIKDKDKVIFNNNIYTILKTGIIYNGDFDLQVADNMFIPSNRSKKVIATTDLTLKPSCTCTESAAIYCGSKCQKSLPTLPQQFIEQYIEFYNKEEVITDVLVEYENGYIDNKSVSNGMLKVISKDNTINIVLPKTNYSTDEVKQLLRLAWATASAYGDKTDEADCEDWINHNLK